MEYIKFPTVNPKSIKPCPNCGSSELCIVENDQTNRYNFAHFCFGGQNAIEILKMTTAEETFETEQEAIEAWNKRA